MSTRHEKEMKESGKTLLDWNLKHLKRFPFPAALEGAKKDCNTLYKENPADVTMCELGASELSNEKTNKLLKKEEQKRLREKFP